ncbi:MAG: lamin tail domain-containing protein [Verrucomicrobia bacterium]|nr:lamin tail domain-containing protein [Verrucomicrobiota bacterium]
MLLLDGRVAAEVTVTEFLASNRGVLPDEDGEYCDWIEVHNPTPKVVDLKGWTLTDDPTRPTQWVFPSTNLPPGGFLVVFASGKDRSLPGRPLHTGFSLSADGEYLALFPPDSENPTFETLPPFPKQRSDVSFGTLAGRWFFFSPPSPGATNSGGFVDRVADTKFSHDRGFYEKPLDLVIGTQTQDSPVD